MQLKECYDSFGGNYEDVRSRLMKDELIQRFAFKFLDDKSFETLKAELSCKNYGEAFRAAHSMKGLSKNMSFDRLSSSVEQLTETLRKWETVPVDEALCEKQWQQVKKDYEEVVSAIQKLKEEA